MNPSNRSAETCPHCERLRKKRALLRAALSNIANAGGQRLALDLIRVAAVALWRDDDRKLSRNRRREGSADVAPTFEGP